MFRTRSVRLAAAALALLAFTPVASFAQFTAVTKPPLGNRGNGFGVAWGDVDGDGDPDLYVTHDGPNLLMRNEGAGNFSDITAPPLDDAGNGSAAVWGDVDDDGDLDLYLVNYMSPNRLFRNDGLAGFTDVTTPPLGDTGPGQGAAWADYDRDGDLDLYVVNYGTPNKLLRNEGGCVFSDATRGLPLGDAGWGVAATWGDYDSDGDPDLYVTNDGPNRLLRNDGGGNFVNVASGGTADSGAGQSAAWGDFDNDGDLDLYITNYGTANKLLRNDGGAFTPLTQGPLGTVAASMGVAWGDYDNDGDLDLYLSTDGSGNRLLRNDGGAVFTTLTSGDLGDTGLGTGVAWADHDLDGDLDLYLANDGTGCKLLRNDLASGAGWLHIGLEGIASNRSGIGARVEVLAGGIWRMDEISGGTGYLSQNSLTAEFGLGTASVADSVVVRWPSGILQRLGPVAAGRITLTEPEGLGVPERHEEGALDLSPPTPNPARADVRISFALPLRTRVRVAIHDVQGRLVAVLADAEWPAGAHSLLWTGRDRRGHSAPAGVYLVRLEASGELRTRRLARVP